MSKHKKMYIQSNQLLTIKPVGTTQEKVFEAWKAKKNLFLTGSAGTGKTFIPVHWKKNLIFTKILIEFLLDIFLRCHRNKSLFSYMIS